MAAQIHWDFGVILCCNFGVLQKSVLWTSKWNCHPTIHQLLVDHSNWSRVWQVQISCIATLGAQVERQLQLCHLAWRYRVRVTGHLSTCEATRERKNMEDSSGRHEKHIVFAESQVDLSCLCTLDARPKPSSFLFFRHVGLRMVAQQNIRFVGSTEATKVVETCPRISNKTNDRANVYFTHVISCVILVTVEVKTVKQWLSSSCTIAACDSVISMVTRHVLVFIGLRSLHQLGSMAIEKKGTIFQPPSSARQTLAMGLIGCSSSWNESH